MVAHTKRRAHAARAHLIITIRVTCHDGKKIYTEKNKDNKEISRPIFSLMSRPGNVRGGGRAWSDSYIALTKKGRPNAMVNRLNVQSIPPMLPPYFAGAAKSRIFEQIAGGKCKVKLSREELDKIAKTEDPQTFTFRKRKVTWVKFTELVQDKPLGWCAFTEVQVWGQ